MKTERVFWPSFWHELKCSRRQAAFLGSRAKMRLLNCGRYGGKSFLALIVVVWTALWLYGMRKAGRLAKRHLGPLVTVGIVAPTEYQYSKLWEQLIGLVPQIPGRAPDGRKNTDTLAGEARILLFGELGIVIELISAWTPENIRGGGYDILFVDEGGLLKRASIWNSILKPMVIRAGYWGLVLMASTPRNNFWDRWVEQALNKTGAMRGFEAFCWTSFDNPMLTAEQRDEALLERDENPWNYRREYLAELFVEVPAERIDSAIAAYDSAMIHGCEVEEVVECRGPYGAGLDLAWGGTDDAVLAIVDKPTNFLCHLEEFRTTSDPDLISIFNRTHEQWGAPEIYFDRTGGRARALAEFIPSRVRAKPLVFRRSIDRNRHADFIVSKHVLVESLGRRMSLGKLRVPDRKAYDWSRLPYANQQNQEKNFGKWFRQMEALQKVVVKKANGEEEYLYRPGPALDPESGKWESRDDYCDGTLLVSRTLPLAAPVGGMSLEELEKGLMGNW